MGKKDILPLLLEAIFSPLSTLRSVMHTFAPSSANLLAIPAPYPEAPPSKSASRIFQLKHLNPHQ